MAVFADKLKKSGKRSAATDMGRLDIVSRTMGGLGIMSGHPA